MKNTIITTTIALAAGLGAVAQEVTYTAPIKLSSSINSEAEEVMPVLAEEGNVMYYVRAFHPDNSGGENTGHDIWMSRRTKAMTWENATNVAVLNNEFSNGIVGLSADGQTAYLMNKYTEGQETEPGISFARKSGDSWSTPETITIPGLTPSTRLYGFFVSPDERTIIFSMETEESAGMEDLYVSSYDPLVGWSNPVSMGPQVNSSGYEISPFLTADGSRLYFSSDRSGGFGDADVYVAERTGPAWTDWSTPENLGSIINSNSFDAYFTILADSTIYFSSSRDGELSEIYRSKMESTVQPVLVQEPTVGERPTYIFFEFDSYALSNGSKDVLKLVSDTLNDLSGYKVKLEGHADHIGTDEYNIKLSERRANAAKNYLASQGISSDRMSIEAFGESQPMAPNTTADGSDNPEGRAQNRRVKIKLIKPEMAETSEVDELLE